MRLATTTADFYGYCETTAEMVRAYEGTGFRHLDYSFYRANYPGSPFMGDDWIREVADASKEAERLGFDFVQAHSPGNDYFGGDTETVIRGNIRAIEACGYLGIDKLVVHSGRSSAFRSAERMRGYREAVKGFYERLYPAMEKYNVRVLAENYTPAGDDTCSFYSGVDLTELMELCDHPLMGVCWDVGHGNMIRPAQYDDIVKLGKYLQAVHIQDNHGIHDEHIAPLMGTLRIDEVMRGLRDNGFIAANGVFTFEADNLLSYGGAWPDRTDERGERVKTHPSLQTKRAAVRMLYEIGKNILSEYGLSED